MVFTPWSWRYLVPPRRRQCIVKPMCSILRACIACFHFLAATEMGIGFSSLNDISGALCDRGLRVWRARAEYRHNCGVSAIGIFWYLVEDFCCAFPHLMLILTYCGRQSISPHVICREWSKALTLVGKTLLCRMLVMNISITAAAKACPSSTDALRWETTLLRIVVSIGGRCFVIALLLIDTDLDSKPIFGWVKLDVSMPARFRHEMSEAKIDCMLGLVVGCKKYHERDCELLCWPHMV